MTDAADATERRGILTLPEGTYRRVDRVSKLLGVVLVAVALQVGATTPAGIASACCGTVLATATVFVSQA